MRPPRRSLTEKRRGTEPTGRDCRVPGWPRGEEGSATIWVVWAAVLVASASVLAFAELAVVSARHRAAAGADLAALSAVAVANAGGDACRAAASVATDQQVRVEECAVAADGSVRLSVGAEVGGWLTRLLPGSGGRPAVRAAARAGPGPPPQ